MLPPPSSPLRELLRLYKLAARDEHNIQAFLREHADVVAALGVAVDLERDDAELALQLAPAVGRYKRRAVQSRGVEQAQRAREAAVRLALSSRRRLDSVELDPELLLGGIVADARKKYLVFELETCRIPILRSLLVKARGVLGDFIDLAAFVDECGLHFVWRAGRGGLNLKAQAEEPGADVLHVDLRRPTKTRSTSRPTPVLLAKVLGDLGLL